MRGDGDSHKLCDLDLRSRDAAAVDRADDAMALSQILLLSCLAALARADGDADGAHRAALAADLRKHGEALRKGEPLPADMPEHKQAKLKAAFAEEEVKRKKVHGEMTDMHDWWCDGDGKSNWEGKEHAAEDEDLCKKWDTHLKHEEPEKRTKPETPPAGGAMWRIHKAWCESHPEADGHGESFPCFHFKHPKFREQFEPKSEL